MQAKLFDLSKNNFSNAHEAGFEFEVTLPNTGEPTGFFIKVRGEQSPTVKNYAKRKYNEYQMQVQAAKRRGKDYEIDLDTAEQMQIENAVNRVISWRGLAEEGKELMFSKETAERIFSQNSWIKDLVMENSNEALNYDPKKLTN